MQSHKLHIVSEHSKDRHPYLELAFIDRYDPTEVAPLVPSLTHIVLIRSSMLSSIVRSQSWLRSSWWRALSISSIEMLWSPWMRWHLIKRTRKWSLPLMESRSHLTTSFTKTSKSAVKQLHYSVLSYPSNWAVLRWRNNLSRTSPHY